MTESNCGTEEKLNVMKSFTPVAIICKEKYLEANEEIAKREAYEGKYTIEEDGQPESVAEPTADDILNAMLGVI